MYVHKWCGVLCRLQVQARTPKTILPIAVIVAIVIAGVVVLLVVIVLCIVIFRQCRARMQDPQVFIHLPVLSLCDCHACQLCVKLSLLCDFTPPVPPPESSSSSNCEECNV